jgi:hypothetical protein
MATNAKEWKKNQAKGLKDIPLPSGNTAKVKAPGMQAFLAQGFIPNSLLDIVMGALDKTSGKPQKTAAQRQAEDQKQALQFMQDIANDPAKLADLMVTIDRVWLHCVVVPETLPTPPEDEPRDEELLYVDEVDFDDKMFVFQFAVGGTADLERFREGTTENMDALQNRTRAVRPTKRTGGGTRKSR